MELFTPDFGLIFWMFVSFGIVFLILWRLAWPVILKSVDERAELIDKGVEYAQSAKEQLDNAQAEAQKYITEAQKKQVEMLRDAEKLRTQLMEEARADAQKERQLLQEQTRVAIEQQHKEAEQAIRDQISDFALQIAERVVKQQMDDAQTQTKLVNSLLDEMEKPQ